MPNVQLRLDAGQPAQTVEQTNRLLKAVSEIQLRFTREGNTRSWFEQTLQIFLDVSDSEYGFIGTVHEDDDGKSWLQSQAVSNITWDQSSRELYESSLSDGLQFRNLQTLSGETLRTGEILISNSPEDDSRSGELPSGHPALQAFMAIPLKVDDQFIGMVGIANRPGGYDTGLVDWLEPLCTTCVTLMIASSPPTVRPEKEFPRQYSQNEPSSSQCGGEQKVGSSKSGNVLRLGAKAELEKLKTQAYWQMVVHNVPDFILLIGRNGQIHFLNHFQEGYDERQVLKSTVFDYQPVEYHETVKNALERVFEHGEHVSYETVGRGKSDEWRTYACRLVPVKTVDNVPFALMIATDVTEERAAREAEARHFGILKAITQNTSELIFAKDLKSRPVFVNDATARVYGTTVEKMLGKTEDDYFSEETLQKTIEDDLRVIRNGKSETFEEVLSLKTGERTFLTTKCPWRDQNGEIIGVVGIAQDVTEWKETQNALHQSREHLQAIIDNSPGCVKLVAEDGTLLQMNAAGLCMTEAESEESVVGQQVFDLIAPEYRETFIDFHKRVCGGYSGAMQFEIVGLQGTRRCVETHAVPLRIGPEKQTVQLAITHDITADREAEATIAAQQSQLIHVSRLSSMGQMVAVISHEITQPLAAIANFASACTLLTGQNEPDLKKLHEYLESITDQSARAGQILRRIRNFVKHSDEHRVESDICQLIKDSLTLVRANLRSRQVILETSFPARPVLVSVDPIQIQQVVVNLVSNACEAMEAPSTEQRRISIKVTDVEDSVEVEFVDSGPGLTDVTQDQLFSPFYTSKSNGMGMGLTICSDIIKSHFGTIMADNVPNAGARFWFTLPRSKEDKNE